MASTDHQPRTAIEHFNASAARYEKYSGGCTRELSRILLELPQLADAGADGSVVLDNACGTGIVAEELIQRHRTKKSTAKGGIIHIVDAAPNMVDIAQQKLESLNVVTSFRICSGVMSGENLEIGDETFTHSITNLGILFFLDSASGAKEIYRTLQVGGAAVVTSWSDLGYIKPIIQPAQLEIRPDDSPYQLPISPDWLSVAHLRTVLLQSGFENVIMSEVVVHYGAATTDELAALLTESFEMLWKNWSAEEQDRFRCLVRERTSGVVESYTMPNGMKGVGIPMKASVAVCRKSHR